MGDHNIGEDVKVTPVLKHSCEEPGLAQQIDQTWPREIKCLIIMGIIMSDHNENNTNKKPYSICFTKSTNWKIFSKL